MDIYLQRPITAMSEMFTLSHYLFLSIVVSYFSCHFAFEDYSFSDDIFFYSKEQMETKLLYAINADAGFDLS